MMKISFTNFYKSINDAYKPYLTNNKKINIYYGGSGSGKSFFVAQRLIARIILNNGYNTLVIRKVDRSNSSSTFPQVKAIINNFGINHLFKINSTTKDITYIPNGNKILFKGLNNIEDLKSITFETGPLVSIWVEEANQITSNEFDLLLTRLRGVSLYKKQITLSFNPISIYSWIKTYFFDQNNFNDEEIDILKTTYKDNRYLLKEDIDVLEGLKKRNPSYYAIYALGDWGQIEGLVFNNYEIKDFEYIEEDFDDVYYGMDFGLRHPTVVVKCGLKNGNIYIFDEFYRTEISTTEIIDIMDKNKFMDKHKYVIADNSRPDTIREWNNRGYAVHAAKKGPGSVKAGIDFLRSYKIIISKSNCPEVAAEFNNYAWKTTKDGKSLDEPVGINDDGIDSLRYALEPLWNNYGNISTISLSSLGL